MNRAEVIAFIKANPLCHLATLEGNKPHVRGVAVWKADEDGIIIQTSTPKDVYKQLSANPNVELCFNNLADGIQVRLNGKAELIDDLDLKKEIVAERSFLKPLVDEEGYGAIVVYRIKGAAHVWTIEANFAPKTYIQI